MIMAVVSGCTLLNGKKNTNRSIALQTESSHTRIFSLLVIYSMKHTAIISLKSCHALYSDG